MRNFKRISVSIVVLFCSLALFAKPAKKGEVIEANSPENPFVSTSWDCKGVTVFEFDASGNLYYGFTESPYELVKTEESYTLTFKAAGVKSVITLESKDSSTLVCEQFRGSKVMVKMVCTKK